MTNTKTSARYPQEGVHISVLETEVQNPKNEPGEHDVFAFIGVAGGRLITVPTQKSW